MKKYYSKLSTEPLEVQLQGCILAGSLTDCKIQVGSVQVQEYSAGFNIDGNDFKEISFD